ncbi:MAG: hypothetical protein AAFX93_17785 [Verrucomicrobiota bacterium]
MATKKTAKKKASAAKTPVKKAAAKKAVAKKAVVKKAAVKKAAVKKAATKKVAAKKTTVKKKAPEAPVATKKSSAPKASKSTPPLTTIVADIDVGWGNVIYLRGEGGPLRWDTGIQMDCADGKWTWSTTDAEQPLVFKFVFNDKVWSKGENMSVTTGATAVLRPTF